MPTSARYRGMPEPSTTVPSLMRRSSAIARCPWGCFGGTDPISLPEPRQCAPIRPRDGPARLRPALPQPAPPRAAAHLFRAPASPAPGGPAGAPIKGPTARPRTPRARIGPSASTLTRISHQLPAADANLLAVTRRTPSSRPHRSVDYAFGSAKRSFGPCALSPRHLDALATKVGEICGLSLEKSPIFVAKARRRRRGLQDGAAIQVDGLARDMRRAHEKEGERGHVFLRLRNALRG